MIKSPIEYIIFDMDGTLIDSESVYTEGYRQAFEKRHINIKLEEIESWTGKSSMSTLSRVDSYTKDRKISEQIRLERNNHFYECMENDTLTLKPNAKEIIKLCKKKGLKIGFATSTFEEVASKVLHHFNFYTEFDIRIFGSDVKKLKPAPDIYLKAVRDSNIPPVATLVVEDSKVGVDSAHASNLKVVQLVDNSHNQPLTNPKAVKHITNLEELKSLL